LGYVLPFEKATHAVPLMARFSSGNLPARLTLLLNLAAASLGVAATEAQAQETLRVGRAIANSWSFVPPR
jgi:hypothetical protein